MLALGRETIKRSLARDLARFPTVCDECGMNGNIHIKGGRHVEPEDCDCRSKYKSEEHF